MGIKQSSVLNVRLHPRLTLLPRSSLTPLPPAVGYLRLLCLLDALRFCLLLVFSVQGLDLPPETLSEMCAAASLATCFAQERWLVGREPSEPQPWVEKFEAKSGI